jgi:hypothetical protein
LIADIARRAYRDRMAPRRSKRAPCGIVEFPHLRRIRVALGHIVSPVVAVLYSTQL